MTQFFIVFKIPEAPRNLSDSGGHFQLSGCRPRGLRKKKFKKFELPKFSAAARYLVTEKKPDFFGFLFPNAHKVASYHSCFCDWCCG